MMSVALLHLLGSQSCRPRHSVDRESADRTARARGRHSLAAVLLTAVACGTAPTPAQTYATYACWNEGTVLRKQFGPEPHAPTGNGAEHYCTAQDFRDADQTLPPSPTR